MFRQCVLDQRRIAYSCLCVVLLDRVAADWSAGEVHLRRAAVSDNLGRPVDVEAGCSKSHCPRTLELLVDASSQRYVLVGTGCVVNPLDQELVLVHDDGVVPDSCCGQAVLAGKVVVLPVTPPERCGLVCVVRITRLQELDQCVAQSVGVCKLIVAVGHAAGLRLPEHVVAAVA